MFQQLKSAYTPLIKLGVSPLILFDYLHPDTGSEYGVDVTEKLKLAYQMRKNLSNVTTASGLFEHLVMAEKILNIPSSKDGVIVEAGCYKGGSTANLSLVASKTDRELHVFDSFEGLPEPDEGDDEHIVMGNEEIHTYEEGAWEGSLDEVKSNVRRYGDIDVCSFHKGFFDDTMPEFDRRCTFIFADVDLRSSLEDVISNLWPLLQDNCFFFTHEAHHREISTLFFDEDYWKTELDTVPPTLVGAGNGLGLYPSKGGFSSPIGYTVKNPSDLEINPQTGIQ